ncbi:hypothetical protein [Fusobacterium necrophorum]|uniref:hypothetical protein n=1 Tax=Fusobacterium necrophorum TaxID=859 RepID=UPI00254C056F|nr:hypothetical protein [Fusobacterium necrophorum]MDK4525002.1 hypothetical protein [Fusobacterium necrophorum]
MGNFILIDKDGVIFLAHFHKKMEPDFNGYNIIKFMLKTHINKDDFFTFINWFNEEHYRYKEGFITLRTSFEDDSFGYDIKHSNFNYIYNATSEEIILPSGDIIKPNNFIILVLNKNKTKEILQKDFDISDKTEFYQDPEIKEVEEAISIIEKTTLSAIDKGFIVDLLEELKNIRSGEI